MDELKDSQKSDNLSRIIDAQHLRTDPFGKNRAAERLYRRVERIIAALYLLTRHVPESDPLCIEIRSDAISLLGKVIDMKDEMRATDSRSLFSFESSVRRLISLVRILMAAGRISFQNAETITGALDELTAFIASSQRTPLSEGIALTREEIMGDTSPLHDRNTIKDIRDSKKVMKDMSVREGSRTSPSGSRAQGIIAILQGAGALGIKDVAARLPDYSEKMIQRELAALVQSGQVKKEGFKRWSKYSLVQ